MLDSWPTGSQPLASPDGFTYNYTISPFRQIIRQPSPDLEHLAEITVWDVSASAETTLYYSAKGFTSKPSDTLANTHFPSRLVQSLRFSQSMFGAGQLGGRSSPAFGDIVLENNDGGLDYLTEYEVDGRSVQIKIGSPGLSYDDFGTILTAKGEGWVFGEDQVVLNIQDPTVNLDVQIQQTLYTSTAGDLEGTPKPLCFGVVKNISPKLINPATLQYQVNDGAIESIDKVYDGGVSTAVSVNTSAGTFKLGSSPVYEITCDVTGAVFTSTAAPKTTGRILRHVLSTYGGLSDPDDLVPADFSDLETDAPGTVGIYIPEPETVISVIDRLLIGVGGFYAYDTQGRFAVGVLKAPNVGSYVEQFDQTTILSLRRKPIPDEIAPVVWRYRVGYERNWTIQNSGLAGAVTDQRRAFLLEDYRVRTAEDAAIKNRNLLATEPPLVEALFASASVAQTEADRRLTLFGEKRALYEISVKAAGYDLRLDDLVRVTYPRYDLTAGKTVRVVGINTDAQANTLVLEVLG